MVHNPVICAIDTADVPQAEQLVGQLSGHVGAVKLGLEFVIANGPAGVAKIAAQKVPIFLDLKFHDIPNTVAGAVRSTAGLDAFMMTVHTGGGKAMLRAAADASQEVATITGKARPLIIGVTVLTSMDEHDMAHVGVQSKIRDQVARLAALACESGLDGVVCSPHEISLVRAECGQDFTLVVPGIRPEGSAKGDQKRVLTPKEALAQGADYLVIGRPITGEKDPAKAAQNILKAI